MEALNKLLPEDYREVEQKEFDELKKQKPKDDESLK